MNHIDDAQQARRSIEDWLAKTPVVCGRCSETVPTSETRIVEEPIVRPGRTYPGQAMAKQRRVCGNC